MLCAVLAGGVVPRITWGAPFEAVPLHWATAFGELRGATALGERCNCWMTGAEGLQSTWSHTTQPSWQCGRRDHIQRSHHTALEIIYHSTIVAI